LFFRSKPGIWRVQVCEEEEELMQNVMKNAHFCTCETFPKQQEPERWYALEECKEEESLASSPPAGFALP